MKKKIGKTPKIYIGTSGWSYTHWKENFYPEKLKPNLWLGYYSSFFPTVEINTTFYHLPLATTIRHWYDQVPKDFLFSLKTSRYITHRKRLKDCGNSVKLFYKVIKGLKSKIGPILIQLPPSFKMDKDRLVEFLHHLSDDYQYVFEFRHASWFVEEIYELLSQKGIALCITDLYGSLSPEVITANFTYIRLHGPKKSYQGTYGPAKIKSWKRKIENWTKNNISVYCYFDNDEKGYAIQDAKTLYDLLKY
jgi:uncharacterized protein YecE (DUF72 family)